MNRDSIKLVGLLFLGIATDQLTKFCAWLVLFDTEGISLFWRVIDFRLVYNPGGFLSLLSGLSEQLRFLLLTCCVGILLSCSLYYLLFAKKTTKRYDQPLAWVTAGGLSNLLDRILHDKGVIDFVSIGLGDFRTGIFNLADVYILTGSFILGYILFTKDPRRV